MSVSSTTSTPSGAAAFGTVDSPVTSGLSGLVTSNSGLNISQIISELMQVDQEPITLMQNQVTSIQSQESAYAHIQSDISGLDTAIQQVTTPNADGSTIFDNTTVTSSNSSIATATSTGQATAQTINLQVDALPSKTVATSTAGVGSFSLSSPVSALGITAGNFTIYDNGTPHTISVGASDTVGDVLTSISGSVSDIQSASIVNGEVQFTYANSPATKISFGGGGDTSNFLSTVHLDTAVDNGTGTITASQANNTLNRDATLSTAAANLNTAVTDGTFTINGVNFDTTGQTMNDVIYAINNSAANVTASFNDGTNTFQLTAKNTGGALINMSDGTGNFLQAMNLISGTNTTSSQVAGSNAKFVLNGTTMYSTSATVPPTVSGLSGVTLNLAGASPGTTVQLNVQPDTSGAVTAISNVITAYNTAINDIDTATNAQNGGILANQTQLIDLRNQIRQMFTSAVPALSGTQYNSLQQVGISTGAVGSSSGSASPDLQLDTTTLQAALAADPTDVKNLFIAQQTGNTLGGNLGTGSYDGVFTQLDELMTSQSYTNGGTTQYGALYVGTSTSTGLFDAYNQSANAQIASINQNISDAQANLATKQASLQQEFDAMDSLVGQYKSQGTALTQMVAQSEANSSSSSSSSSI